MKKPSKKRRKELREIYENIKNQEYVQKIKNESNIGLMEWVDLMVEYKDKE